MTDKIKAVLKSEKGMSVVNLLFLLSILIRNSGIIFIAYIAWVVYLSYSIKTASSKAVRIANRIFIVFAVSMLAVNLYLLFHTL